MNPEYFDQISDAFLASSGRGLVLSPRDQMLVAGWARDGIPARVVVDGIEKAFSGEVQGRTRSMAYAVPAVEESIVAWRSKNVGQAVEVVDDTGDMETAFQSLVTVLREAIDGESSAECTSAMEEALTAVGDLRSGWRSEEDQEVSRTLSEIESRLCAQLMDVMDPDLRIDIERSVDGSVSEMRFSSAAARTQTRRALIRKRLRQRHGIPVFEIDLAGGW